MSPTVKSNQLQLAIAALEILLIGTVNSQACEVGSVGPLLWMPSMNTFRRFTADSEPMYTFYTDVLGFEPLEPYEVGNNSEVWRIQAGASQLKLSRRVANRLYVDGGVADATGLRLWTFFFSDEEALIDKFTNAGLAAPVFEDACSHPAMNCAKSALISDPSGQDVEIVITGDAKGTQYEEMEVGIVVSDLSLSMLFYRDFLGLEEIGVNYDVRLGTEKHVFRNGATFVSLRSFGGPLPADTGTAGIQYVVTDVAAVQDLARCQGITIDQEVSSLPGFMVRFVWLEDRDGVTNYFADTAESRGEVEA
ncbi:uncharacterized protein DNG_09166 [Cephalotrichum gorgonifer]|uniref:VOC domain-containing protein n=1 Tax=Cephalotrichum gorgonifer TaxID=2041049 RepID=A0AAE8N557_9PEZI|nr:uncharacterized protein DNG_09166 [Cephalotrichum gorgonifer]